MIKKLFVILFAVTLIACQPVETPQSEDIISPVSERTELRVGTLYGPQIYLNSEELGESGFDFEMANKFADYLGLPLQMVPLLTANNCSQLSVKVKLASLLRV